MLNMSNTNIGIQSSNECIDECVDSTEEAISKKNIKFYEYKHFSNFQKKVYHANWKNSE